MNLAYHIPAARWADARAENIRSTYGRSDGFDHTFDYACFCLHFVYKSFTESGIFSRSAVVLYWCSRATDSSGESRLTAKRELRRRRMNQTPHDGWAPERRRES